MGWIESRGGKHRARYKVGAETHSATFATKAEAKRFLASVETDLARGQWIDPRGGEVTVREWVAAWQSTRGTVKVSTSTADDGRLRTHVLPMFGDLRLNDVTPGLVRRWVSDLSGTARSGARAPSKPGQAPNKGPEAPSSVRVRRPLAPKTIRHCHGLLHSVMQAAVEEGLIRKNPCVGTRLPEVVRRDLVCLTEQQLEQVIAATDEHYRPLVLTLAGTGLRWGEAVGLKVKRVDLLRRELTVAESLSEVGGRFAYVTPKTRASRRVVSLPQVVVDALVPLVAGRGGDEAVFTTREGHLIRHAHFLYRVWRPAVAVLGLESPPRIHDLRHTHVALLIAAGTSLSAIKRRLGHDNINVTDSTYGYLLPRVEEGVLAALDAVFSPSPDARESLDV